MIQTFMQLRSSGVRKYKPRNLGFSRFLSQIALCVMRRGLRAIVLLSAELVAYQRQRKSLSSF